MASKRILKELKDLQSPSPSISTQANPPLSLVSSLSDQGLELKVRGAN